jgi:hypothetical protein
MYHAVNKGVNMARGEILCYLNSDDLYFPWSVEVAVGQIATGADLVYGDLAILHRGPTHSFFYLQFYPDFDLRYYTHVATIGQPTVFWTRSLTNRIGPFDSSYGLIADCEYWLRAGMAGARIEHIEEVLALQVDHADTLRSTQRARLRKEFERLRSDFSVVVPPPAWPSLEQLKKSLIWRRRQFDFRRALRRRTPTRWPRFTGFLERRGIQIDDVALLAFTLPSGIRPSRSPWGDVKELERQLMSEIGVNDP